MREENTYIVSLFLIAAFVLSVIAFTVDVNGQAQDVIKRRCPAPNGTVFGSILVSGDIFHTPCPSRASIFTGNVNFTGATVTGVMTGTGTANFVPRFTAAQILGNTPLSWNGTSYVFSDTALTSDFTMNLTPTAAAGRFRVGKFAAPLITYIDLNQTAGTVDVGSNGNNGVFFSNSAFGGFALLYAGGQISLSAPKFAFGIRTVTAAGTTGAQTIDKSMGSVNFGAAATTLVVTNSIAAAASLIFTQPQTADATCTHFAVTRAAGSFTLTANAACTAETPVAFWVTN